MAHKPEKAVILFVTHNDGIYACNLLAGVYWGISNPGHVKWLQDTLTARDIPWDNWGKGNPAACGVEIKGDIDRLVKGSDGRMYSPEQFLTSFDIRLVAIERALEKVVKRLGE